MAKNAKPADEQPKEQEAQDQEAPEQETTEVEAPTPEVEPGEVKGDVSEEDLAATPPSFPRGTPRPGTTPGGGSESGQPADAQQAPRLVGTGPAELPDLDELTALGVSPRAAGSVNPALTYDDDLKG
jgi:hypothetical protein